MMRRFVLIVGTACLAFGATWACTFPDVTFGPDGEDGTEAGADGALAEGSAADGSPDAPVDEDSGPILIDGSTLDALVVVDAGGKVDAAGCMTCDCDNDHYSNLDDDSRTHPNQGFLFDKPEAPRFGDWDCNGTVEKLWTREDTTCAGLTLGLGCSNIYGFTSPVACGEKGAWIRCKKRPGLLPLDCVVDEQRLETQLCK